MIPIITKIAKTVNGILAHYFSQNRKYFRSRDCVIVLVKPGGFRQRQTDRLMLWRVQPRAG
jgi:hypothetical protein